MLESLKEWALTEVREAKQAWKAMAIVLVFGSCIGWSAARFWDSSLLQVNEQRLALAEAKVNTTPTPASAEALNIIQTWGPLPNRPNTVFASLDTGPLAKHAQSHRVVLLCVPADGRSETRDDAALKHSPFFDITGAVRRIEVELPTAMVTRLMPTGTLQFYALMVPNTWKETDITTVNGALRNGAVLVGVRGLFIVGTPARGRGPSL